MRRLAAGLLALGIASVLAVAACDAEPSPSQPAPGALVLAGTSWTLVAVNGRGPVPAARPTLMFTATDASGSGGCNRYGGKYRYDPMTGAMAFDDMGMTLMLCAGDARSDIESAFFGALVGANHAALDPDGNLTLTGPAGVLVLENLQPGGA